MCSQRNGQKSTNHFVCSSWVMVGLGFLQRHFLCLVFNHVFSSSMCSHFFYNQKTCFIRYWTGLLRFQNTSYKKYLILSENVRILYRNVYVETSNNFVPLMKPFSRTPHHPFVIKTKSIGWNLKSHATIYDLLWQNCSPHIFGFTKLFT